MSRSTLRDESDASLLGEPPATAPASGRARPRSRAADRDEFVAALLDDLDPRGPAEFAVTLRIASAAWRLQARRDSRTLRPGAERDEVSLSRALRALSRLRTLRAPRWGTTTPPPKAPVAFDLDADDDGRTLIPPPPVDDDRADDDPSMADLWRDRLIIDPHVSERSPAVRGTFVTVGHVVSLIVDGWSWADILRTHPELSEADIRACLAYTVEEEGTSLAAGPGGRGSRGS